jgi:thymidylate synthase ThyX
MAQNTFDYGIKAQLVYDGGTQVHIPPEMGHPRADQMIGTPAERLCELAGRVCYDSLGQGRNSAEYHGHIKQVGHLSVYEHFNFTCTVKLSSAQPLQSLLGLFNRRGLWIEPWSSNYSVLAVTCNLRTALEWHDWTYRLNFDLDARKEANAIGAEIQNAANNLAPQVFNLSNDGPTKLALRPATEEQQWVSLYLSGSRGFSHEQVRHGDFTAISQRSTRYCDETHSPWIAHPLLTHVQDQFPCNTALEMERLQAACEHNNRTLYRLLYENLSLVLAANGVEKGQAKKQARGVARGYLPNSLQTEMIFSASVGQWKRMLRQRLTDAADAEIRILYGQVLKELLRCRYADQFAGFKLKPASDGVGEVLAE